MKLSKIRPAIGRDNVYFHKIFRYLAITTFILFFCFTFIISALIIRRYSQEIVSGSLQNMDASVTASDSALNGLYSYCYFLANNNAAVNDILYADRFSSELSIQFSSLKDDFLNYYDLIDSFYLINFGADMAFSSTTTRQTLDSFHDQQILELLNGHSGPKGNFPSGNFPPENLSLENFLFLPRSAASGAPADVITLAFRTGNGNAFVINLKRSAYETLLNHNAVYSDTLVINSRGLVINNSSDMAFGADLSETGWYQDIQASNQSQGELPVRLHSTRYNVLYQKSASFGFTYVTLLAVSPFSTKNTMLYSTLASFVLFTFLGLGLSLLLSYTLYLPVNNLIKLLTPHYRQTAEGHPDEISYLTDTVTDLVHTSAQNRKQLHMTERHRILQRILTAEHYFGALKGKTLDQYELSFDAEYYQAVLFSLESAQKLLSSNPPDYKLMLDSLQNIASELMPESLWVEMENGILAYILFSDTDDARRFTPLIAKAGQCMSEYFHEPVTAGVGLPCDTPSSLPESYAQAKMALRYRFLAGGGNVLNYADLPADNDSAILLQEQKDIVSAMLSCKEPAALEKLDSYFQCLSSSHIDNILLNLMALNTALRTAEAQSGIQARNQFAYDSNPYSHYTLREVRSLFTQRISEDVAQLREIRQNISAKPRIIDETIAYVEEHISSGSLNVEQIASRIHLSTNYLRNIFKEHMGVSLSKYITDKKIQYACRVLAETDDSIQSICERLDFTSANYFYTYFKKNTGMTPSQYRERHRANVRPPGAPGR